MGHSCTRIPDGMGPTILRRYSSNLFVRFYFLVSGQHSKTKDETSNHGRCRRCGHGHQFDIFRIPIVSRLCAHSNRFKVVCKPSNSYLLSDTLTIPVNSRIVGEDAPKYNLSTITCHSRTSWTYKHIKISFAMVKYMVKPIYVKPGLYNLDSSVGDE